MFFLVSVNLVTQIVRVQKQSQKLPELSQALLSLTGGNSVRTVYLLRQEECPIPLLFSTAVECFICFCPTLHNPRLRLGQL